MADSTGSNNDRGKGANESWEGYAERLIQEAQLAGEFDHLPGTGKPSPLIDSPYEEMWWIRDKLKREQLIHMPPALQIREDRKLTLEQADRLSHEEAIRALLLALNERIADAMQSGRPGPPSTTLPVDIEGYLAQRRND